MKKFIRATTRFLKQSPWIPIATAAVTFLFGIVVAPLFEELYKREIQVRFAAVKEAHWQALYELFSFLLILLIIIGVVGVINLIALDTFARRAEKRELMMGPPAEPILEPQESSTGAYYRKLTEVVSDFLAGSAEGARVIILSRWAVSPPSPSNSNKDYLDLPPFSVPGLMRVPGLSLLQTPLAFDSHVVPRPGVVRSGQTKPWPPSTAPAA
jgi:hypothetical protein